MGKFTERVEKLATGRIRTPNARKLLELASESINCLDTHYIHNGWKTVNDLLLDNWDDFQRGESIEVEYITSFSNISIGKFNSFLCLFIEDNTGSYSAPGNIICCRESTIIKW